MLTVLKNAEQPYLATRKPWWSAETARPYCASPRVGVRDSPKVAPLGERETNLSIFTSFSLLIWLLWWERVLLVKLVEKGFQNELSLSSSYHILILVKFLFLFKLLKVSFPYLCCNFCAFLSFSGFCFRDYIFVNYSNPLWALCLSYLVLSPDFLDSFGRLEFAFHVHLRYI